MTDGELGAVLCALAGPRRGDAVAGVGAPPVALRAVLAAAGTSVPVPRGARVAVTGADPDDAEAAAARLAPGGRLVGVATDRTAAVQLVEGLGLALRHVEPCGDRVAWSAVAALRP